MWARRPSLAWACLVTACAVPARSPEAGAAVAKGDLADDTEVGPAWWEAEEPHNSSAPQGGAGGELVLDLSVYVPDGLSVQGRAVRPSSEDPAVRRRVQSFFERLEALTGVGRGHVRVRRLPESFREVDDFEERLDLFRAIAARASELRVAWVEGGADVAESWGRSSGVPGMMLEGGALSGVLINVGRGFGPEADGLAMMHELGHFVGLEHTTEHGAWFADAFDDTPFCEHIDLLITACPDAANLMFPEFYGAVLEGRDPWLSAQQRAELRRSPIFRRLGRGFE